MRADALRNRQRVLDAALEAFAESGFDAQMPEIARRADVGVGTLYRHFATKEDLVAALADDHFQHMEELGQEMLDSDLAPGDALEQFVRRAARRIAEDRGMAELVSRKREVMQQRGAPREHLHELAAELIRRAQASGDVRKDASATDIPTILCGLGHVIVAERSGLSPISWERYLTLMLDGLRAR